jgi:hypothetical protein
MSLCVCKKCGIVFDTSRVKQRDCEYDEPRYKCPCCKNFVYEEQIIL